MKKNKKKPDGYLCVKCKGIVFSPNDWPADKGLPAVRGMKCDKCGATYWNVPDSMKYQKAKSRMKMRTDNAKEGRYE